MPVLSIRIFLLALALSLSIVGGQLDEEERYEEYVKRGYVWPLPEVHPNTPGWNQLMRRRLAQVSQIEDVTDRYNGYYSAIAQALVAPNFTENGWGLTRAPQKIVDMLKESLRNGLDEAEEEYYIEVIDGKNEEFERPLLVKQQRLNNKILKELQPMHEEWAGIPLVGEVAYGLRVYRNQSILNMHADRMSTHIISCILHVDHDEESEPWPIFIEDFQGNLNEVVLESGDMLFYESSKCIHGRPRSFNGKWYSSIFVHYYPAVDWNPRTRVLEAHYAVPPVWSEPQPVDGSLDRAVVVGTSFTEPDCPDAWCGSVNTVKWRGPAKEGVVVTTGYKDEAEKEL